MRKQLLITAFILSIIVMPLLLVSWLGSNPSLGFNVPGYNETVLIPMTPKGWCYNTDNGVDYFEIWLVEDVNTDTIVDAGEYANRVVVLKQEDFNILADNLNLTPRYFVDGDFLTDGSNYFMFIYAVDLNGEVSWDTDITGLTPLGDATHPESCIRYIRARGLKP